MVRSVTRQLDTAYDDAFRDLAEGLERYDRELCPGCGLHHSILADPEHNHFTFEERLCNVCKAQDTYGRIVAERDDLAMKPHGENPAARIPRPADGRHIMMRPMTPDEVDSVRARTSPNGGDHAH